MPCCGSTRAASPRRAASSWHARSPSAASCARRRRKRPDAMDAARADALTARHRLATDGWISPKAESFRHLPPPAVEVWLGGRIDAQQLECEAPPLAGAGWTLHPVGSRPTGGVDARWLDATNATQRAELFAGIAPPTTDDAAPFAWAHRALCRQGLRLRIDGSGRAGSGDDTVRSEERRVGKECRSRWSPYH